MICTPNLWFSASFLCMPCSYIIVFEFLWPVLSHGSWLFCMWFGRHGLWIWACLLQLIRLYAKKHFLLHRLESKDLTLVIVLSLFYGVSASDFEQFIEYLNFFLFLFAAELQFLLCYILWETSCENMFTALLACWYSHYWLSS